MNLNKEILNFSLERRSTMLNSNSFLESRKEYLFPFIVDHMHYKGTVRLSSEDFIKAYLLGDGMGKLSFEEAKKQDFDWSHIRDSSVNALEEINKFILKLYEEDKI